MAFNHVGNCSCPVGCCDCGPPAPERNADFILMNAASGGHDLNPSEIDQGVKQLEDLIEKIELIGDYTYALGLTSRLDHLKRTKDLREKQAQRIADSRRRRRI